MGTECRLARFARMAKSDAASTHASPGQPGAWIVPVIGGSILTLLWGAYTITIVVHMAMLPPP